MGLLREYQKTALSIAVGRSRGNRDFDPYELYSVALVTLWKIEKRNLILKAPRKYICSAIWKAVGFYMIRERTKRPKQLPTEFPHPTCESGRTLEDRDECDKLLSKLPRKWGMACEMHWMRGDTIEKTARALGVSWQATFKYLQKSKKRLLEDKPVPQPPVQSGTIYVQTAFRPKDDPLPNQILPERFDDKLDLDAVRARFVHIHGNHPQNWGLTESCFAWSFRNFWDLRKALVNLGYACLSHATLDPVLAQAYTKARELLVKISPNTEPDWKGMELPPEENIPGPVPNPTNPPGLPAQAAYVPEERRDSE